MPPVYDRARREGPNQLPEVPQNPPAGSLVIVDTFQDSFTKADHGNIGAYSAQRHGFRGPIFAENIGPDNPTPPRAMAAHAALNQGPVDPAKTRQGVQDIARLQASDLLNNVSGDLDKLRARGLHDSAVNVSYGTTPLGMADQLLGIVRSSGDPNSPNHQFGQNVLNAYNIDPSKLGSADPKVSGPEIQRLHNSLLEATRTGMNTPEVKQAQAKYDQAVHNLQANHNSVVVSAGNQQKIPGQWAQEASGLGSKLQPNDNHNLLANSEVTTVGATSWRRTPNGLRERVAGYSNQDPTVDVYASGSVATSFDQNQKTVEGTSFASPPVAGTMATLHGNHPGTSSSQMRNLLNNRLTHQLPGAGAPVLDFHAAEEYMRKGTF